MCGIVAYLGKKAAQPILVEGLKRLEYRGYDSAGVALMGGGGINIKKSSGRISVLEDILDAPQKTETHRRRGYRRRSRLDSCNQYSGRRLYVARSLRYLA